MTRAESPAPLPTVVTDERVREVLEEHVLPYVRNHGGDVVITEVAADGSVTCRLEGACRGCPAAPVTITAVVERSLRAHVSPTVVVHAPQVAISAAARERIRQFFPDRVTTRRR